MKKGFILYKDNYEPIKNLSLSEKGELLEAMFEYNISGKVLELSPVAKMAFQFLKPTFDRDIEKYTHICERNSENAYKRWNSKDATACDRIPDDAKNAHIDIDIDIDKDIHIHKDKVIKQVNKAFAEPTLEEVSNYCLERNNDINPQTFIDYYSSKGWIVGKTRMKDWRAAVRTWENRRAEDAQKGQIKNVYRKKSSTEETIDAVNGYLKSIGQDGNFGKIGGSGSIEGYIPERLSTRSLG